jgi:5-keto 4-deoxyuronate isomerase
MSTQKLLDPFQTIHLFQPAEITGHVTDLDPLVVGGVMPMDKAIERR